MATMFRDFSFEAASRHLPAAHERERAMNVSPFSPLPHHPARPPTPPHCAIGDLATRFNQHSLHVEVDPSYQFRSGYEPLTPPSDDYAFPVELLDQPQQPSLYPRLSAAVLRKQRQANTRMQCSSSHLDDISLLVQRMIEDGDQCRVCERKSPTWSNASTSDEDEGVDMDYSPPTPPAPRMHTLKFRRSGDRLNNGAAVLKSVRLRRKSGISKRLSK